MWDKLVSLSDDNQQVIAKLRPDMNIDGRFDSKGVEEAIAGLGATGFCVLSDEITRFINCAKEGKSEALRVSLSLKLEMLWLKWYYRSMIC